MHSSPWTGPSSHAFAFQRWGNRHAVQTHCTHLHRLCADLQHGARNTRGCWLPAARCRASLPPVGSSLGWSRPSVKFVISCFSSALFLFAAGLLLLLLPSLCLVCLALEYCPSRVSLARLSQSVITTKAGLPPSPLSPFIIDLPGPFPRWPGLGPRGPSVSHKRQFRLLFLLIFVLSF